MLTLKRGGNRGEHLYFVAAGGWKRLCNRNKMRKRKLEWFWRSGQERKDLILQVETCFSNERSLSNITSRFLAAGLTFVDGQPRCFHKMGIRLWRIGEEWFHWRIFWHIHRSHAPTHTHIYSRHPETMQTSTCVHKDEEMCVRLCWPAEEFTFARYTRWFQYDEVCTLRNASVKQEFLEDYHWDVECCFCHGIGEFKHDCQRDGTWPGSADFSPLCIWLPWLSAPTGPKQKGREMCMFQ